MAVQGEYQRRWRQRQSHVPAREGVGRRPVHEAVEGVLAQHGVPRRLVGHPVGQPVGRVPPVELGERPPQAPALALGLGPLHAEEEVSE